MTKNRSLLAAGSVLALALATQSGCAGPATVTQPAGQAAAAPNEAAKPIISGKVVETMNAGGYTYIRLEKDGRTGWVAVPTMEVKVGDEISLLPGAEMGPFASKSLNRTFDKIIFSAGPATKPAAKPAAVPAGHPALDATPAEKSAPAQKPFYAGTVVETMNSGGYTYICLEKDGKKSWAAVPPTTVKVGDEIEILPGTEMGTFKSKTLNKTFDNIIFSPGVAPKK